MPARGGEGAGVRAGGWEGQTRARSFTRQVKWRRKGRVKHLALCAMLVLPPNCQRAAMAERRQEGWSTWEG